MKPIPHPINRSGLLAVVLALTASLAPGLAWADRFTVERAKRNSELAQAEADAAQAQKDRFQMAPGAAAAAAQRQQMQPVGTKPAATPSKPAAAPSGPRFPKPSKTALIVILENGGIVDNLDPAVKRKLNVGFKLAVCRDFTLEMKAPGDLPGLIQQIAQKLEQVPDCLNPLNWRLEDYTLARWVNEQSDEMLENTIKGAQALNSVRRRYDLVEVFEDGRAKPETVMARMKALAPTHVMDIHVLTHGAPEQIVGGNNLRFTDGNFFGPLAAGERALDYRLFIRSVYQMNCFSGSLVDEWASLGAETVNNVRADDLNSVPWQYFHFFGKWVNENRTFEQATREAYAEARLYTAPLYSLLGMSSALDDSELKTVGNGALRVSSR